MADKSSSTSASQQKQHRHPPSRGQPIPAWMLSGPDETEIHKRVERKAMKICADQLKTYMDCMRGKTITVYKCKHVRQDYADCMRPHLQPDDFDKGRLEYLKEKRGIAIEEQ